MRLIHITDPHLTRPPHWRSLFGRSHFGKRFLGYASWSRKRRHRMRREWLDELLDEIKQRSPDQILLTGDLTQIGTLEEIQAAREWLEALGSPEQVSLVPGNHDTYARESWSNLLANWGDYLPEGGASGFPVVRRLDGVTLFGLSSAVPTGLISASGLLGHEQLQRLTAALRAVPDGVKILTLHHPPLPGMIQYRKRLRDASELEGVVREAGVDVVLYGHRHLNLTLERAGATAYCTAPASAAAASFRLLDIEPDGDGHRISQRLVRRTGDGCFEDGEPESWLVSGPG